MKIPRKIPAVVLLVLAAAPMAAAQSGPSQREAIVNSFKEFAKDYMQKWNAQHTQVVFDSFQRGNSKTRLDWRRTYDDPVENYDIDVKPTDSLVTPYLGILKFTIVFHNTAMHNSRERAEKDQKFKTLSTPVRVEFNYQEGNWIKRERSTNP